MITVTLPTLYHEEPIELYYVHDHVAGYGHKNIHVELVYKGVKKEFSSITNNMPGYDDATELEGDEKKIALYDLISHKIEERVQQWIEGIEWDEKQKAENNEAD